MATAAVTSTVLYTLNNHLTGGFLSGANGEKRGKQFYGGSSVYIVLLAINVSTASLLSHQIVRFSAPVLCDILPPGWTCLLSYRFKHVL